MARKITMFELHFDGARFGPTFNGDREASEDQEGTEEATAEGTTTDGAAESSRSRTRTTVAAIAAVALLSLVGRLVVRRARGSGDRELDAESTETVATR